jgi:hypothetical protein
MLELEAAGSSLILVPSYQYTRHHIPQNCNLNTHCREISSLVQVLTSTLMLGSVLNIVV